MAITINPVGFENVSLYGTASAMVVGRSFFQQMLEDDLGGTFFNTKEFTEPVSYIHRTGESTTYHFIINTPYQSVNLQTEVHVTDAEMKIKAHERSLLRKPVQGDQIRVRGVWYTINDVEPDGVGVVELSLNRATQ